MNDAVVYATLVGIVITLSIVLALLLVFSSQMFIIMFAIYLIGISIYYFVYLARNPPKSHDINYDVNKYISIYNMGVGGFVIILGIILATMSNRYRY